MKRIVLLSLGALACASSALAGLSMSLSSSVQNSARGVQVVFSGTLTNASATEKLYLNDIAANFSSVAAGNLALKPNAFFWNVPGVLLPNESYTDSELFRVFVNGTAPAEDYAGTITILGGADIFASDALASTGFTILSPDVSITASDATASEFGPDSGTLTISRTGSTPIDLPVVFNIWGTAINGVSYNAIASVATIPAGSDSATVTITPIADDVAEGDRTAALTLTASTSYNLALAISSSVTIHDKPADAWRVEEFGANANDPAAADAADWDGDGIANLLEFALDLDPKVSTTDSLPQTQIEAAHLTLAYVANADAIDVNYIVEASTDLVSWSSTDVEPVTVPDPNPPGLQTFRYKFSINEVPKAYLRLRVMRIDL